MSKRDRKIEVIKKYIGSAAKNWSAYSYGSIPRTLANNACQSYAGAISAEDILGLIDITISGNGKKGMVFTEYKIYYDNGIMGSRGAVSYKKMYENGTIPGEILDSFYNTAALKEMINKLVNIEGQTIHDDIKDAENMLDSLVQGVEEISATIEKGKELFGAISSLFK